MKAIRLLLRYPLFSFLVFILAITASISPRNVYPANLLQICKPAAIYGIIAIGQTLVILTGGVDLSTGPLTILAFLLTSGLTRGYNNALLWVIPLLLCIGAGLGFFNGLLVVKAKIEPMIATLMTASVVQGAFLLYTGGAPKGYIPPALRFIGTGRLFNFIPTSIVVWLTMSLAMVVVLRKTVFGRYIYYVGSSRLTAYLSGINVEMTIILVYIISGLTSTIAGFVLGGFLGVGTLQLDVMDYSFTPLIAVLLGGTDFVGARGGVGGTIGAVFLVGLLTNLLTILRVAQWGKYILQGLLIILAIALLQLRRGTTS